MAVVPKLFRNSEELDRSLIYDLIAQKQEPSFTLMMPTHRILPERETDPIQFKNLVSELEMKIKKAGLEKHLDLISKLHSVEKDRDFWNHQGAGLAVFINPSYSKVVSTPISLPSLTIISDTFHVKPLYRYYQESGRFQLLVLGQDHVYLYEGDKYGMEALDISGKVPQSMKMALGGEMTDDDIDSADFGGVGASSQVNRGVGPFVHGYTEKSQQKDNDLIRFFRIVDEKVLEHFSTTSGLPLILAALPEHHATFRQVSKNSKLLKTGIEKDVSRVPIDELGKIVWNAFYLEYEQGLAALLKRQQLAESQNLSHTLLDDVVKDALDGKIEILLVEENRIIKGRILEKERGIEYHESGVDDVLDDLSALVIEKSGRVILLPAEKMPHSGGAVSINRY